MPQALEGHEVGWGLAVWLQLSPAAHWHHLLAIGGGHGSEREKVKVTVGCEEGRNEIQDGACQVAVSKAHFLFSYHTVFLEPSTPYQPFLALWSGSEAAESQGRPCSLLTHGREGASSLPMATPPFIPHPSLPVLKGSKLGLRSYYMSGSVLGLWL